jgi:hypothetical protein
LGENQERALAALVEDALAVALEQFVERGGRKLPLLSQNVTKRNFSRKKIPT